MIRTAQIAAVAALLMAPVLAHAETAPAAKVSVAYETLNTAAGRDLVKADIVKAADAYCRANPVGGTVAACRADVTQQLSSQVEAGARQFAKANTSKVLLAQR